MQAAIRRWLSNRRAIRLNAARRARQHMAAARLRARLRGMLARRRAAWLANAISAVLAISAVWRGARARREARRQRAAAARINNWFRSLRGRANLERALHLARMAQIERLLREAEEQRRRLDEKARRAEEAADAFARVAFALRLQAMIRGRWGRKIFARRANAMLRLQIAIRARLADGGSGGGWRRRRCSSWRGAAPRGWSAPSCAPG